MSGGFVDILVVVLFGAFAIAAIIVIFGTAGHIFNLIVETFQRNKLEGVFLLALCALVLVMAVFAEQFAAPHVVALYRQIAS